MKKSIRSLTLALTLAATSLLGATTAAQAQTGSPQSPYVITSAPYTITRSGYYLLGNNINYTGTSGNIITINASNVTIDFNGFYIAGPVNNTAQTVNGLYATERSNITLTNGTIAYCSIGALITGNASATTNNVGHRISGMRVTYCYRYGLEVDFAPGTRIENNQLSQIGGTTATTSYTVGIFFNGGGGTLTGNTVNTVNIASGGSASSSYGISIGMGSFATRNVVSNSYYGVQGSGKYQDNLTYGCTTAFTGGIDAGGNN